MFDSEFFDYLKIGWDHIIDIKAYDHLLFIMTLCAVFRYHEWKKILIIVTAFTIGHSLTLALSALELFVIPSEYTDLLIPFTIFITALANVTRKQYSNSSTSFDKRVIVSYAIALVFGLVHGLGFANNFRFLVGEENSIVKQLFAFNSGLELGQIIVVLFFMFTQFVLSKVFNFQLRDWTVFVSGAGAGLSLMMIINQLAQ